VTKVRETDITAVVWKDTNVVNLLSTFFGADPVVKVKQFDKKLKKHVEVDCPAIIKIWVVLICWMNYWDAIRLK